VAQTLLEVAGLPAPTIVNSIQQAPHEGVSMAYSFDDAGASKQHKIQYFELAGCRRFRSVDTPLFPTLRVRLAS
jgi:arylsulfatase A-like enzyme